MKNIFMLFSVFFLCSSFITDCQALTTREELIAALAENLQLSTVNLETLADQQVALKNRDLCLVRWNLNIAGKNVRDITFRISGKNI